VEAAANAQFQAHHMSPLMPNRARAFGLCRFMPLGRIGLVSLFDKSTLLCFL